MYVELECAYVFVTTCRDIVSLSTSTMCHAPTHLFDRHHEMTLRGRIHVSHCATGLGEGKALAQSHPARKGQGLDWNPQLEDWPRGERQTSIHTSRTGRYLTPQLLFLEQPDNIYLFYYILTIWQRRAEPARTLCNLSG